MDLTIFQIFPSQIALKLERENAGHPAKKRENKNRLSEAIIICFILKIIKWYIKKHFFDHWENEFSKVEKNWPINKYVQFW